MNGVLAALLFAFGAAASVGALELAGRLYAARLSRTMPVDFQSLHGDQMHRYDPELGWTPRPNIRLSIPYAVSTNSLGLRDDEPREKDGRMRILALGDSRTFGDGVSDHETWPYLLEHQLNEIQADRFEVINAGVCGWNALQGLRYLEREGLRLRPHLAICAFGTNEWRRIEPGEMGWIDWEDVQHSWGIEVLLKNAVRGAAAMIAKRPFGPREFRVSPGEYADAIVRMQELCRAEGVAFALLYLPAQSEIGATEEETRYLRVKWLSQGLARYGFAPFWDPVDCFSQPASQFYVDPVHFSPAGNDLVAKYLCDEIRNTL